MKFANICVLILRVYTFYILLYAPKILRSALDDKKGKWMTRQIQKERKRRGVYITQKTTE